MKKLLLLIMAMLFCLSGCGEKEERVVYSATNILMISGIGNTKEISLTTEETSAILAVLNSDNWEDRSIKTSVDYDFCIGTESLCYDIERGWFIDGKNDRHLQLTEEQYKIVFSIVDSYYSPVKIGMTATEIAAIEDFKPLVYQDYVYYVGDNKANYIAKFDSTGKIEMIKGFGMDSVRAEEFYKLEVGMDIYKAVELFGTPKSISDTDTLVFEFMPFETICYNIIFDNEMKVTEVIKVEQ